ncbi:MAG TPA: NlpC/P60 family protein [Chthoniobacterales bacterium]
MKRTVTLAAAVTMAAFTLKGAKAARNPGDVPAASSEATSADNAEAAGRAGEKTGTRVTSLKPEELKELADQPSKVQAVLREALALTERNLAYTYGSDDPAKGGMDCSGFVSFVLQQAGFAEVPRDSSEQYLWVRKHGDFHSMQDPGALAALRPGDLLFWSGTYTIKRDVPITHVMIYLGTGKQSGKPLMVGASEGRSYAGVRQFGVSVFDFKLPSGQPATGDPGRTPKFEGYATIPGARPGDLVDNKPAPHGAVRPSSTPHQQEPLSDGD